MDKKPWFIPDLEANSSTIIVGGERHIVKLIDANLRRQGHTFSLATNRVDALKSLDSGHYQLCILAGDLFDSIADDFESEIRRNPEFDSLQVLRL